MTDPDKPRSPRRGRRPRPAAERKDRVIQTRVPQDLEATLRDAADQNRVSVSHLIRNVLEDTFTLVDNIVADSASLVDTVRRDAQRIAASARRAPPPPGSSARPASAPTPADGAVPRDAALDDIDAWQEVVVNRPARCAQCDAALARGQRAFRGLSSVPGTPPAWLCPSCLSSL